MMPKVQCLKKGNQWLTDPPPARDKETQETLNYFFHYNDNPSQSGSEC